MKDTQSIKWLLTFNNYDKNKITVEKIIKPDNKYKYKYKYS